MTTPSTPPRAELVYLIAPAGHPNYGDEFILRAWMRYLARVRPDADVVVDCHTPGQAAALHADQHPRATFVDTVWRICGESAHLPPAEAVEFSHRVVHDPGILCRIVTGIELLARADVVHLVGGGYINAVWPHHVSLLGSAAAAVERSGGRLVATGQGLAPASDGELLHRWLSRFDVVDVRDAPSVELFGGAVDASRTGDDAWLGIDDGAYDTESDASRCPVVLCLQADLMDDFDNGRGLDGLVDAVAALLEKWGLPSSDVAVVEGIPGIDRVVFDRLAPLLPDAVFVPFTELWMHGLPATAEQTWVSTRFHPHLIAAAAGSSGVILAGRDDYYPIKHRSLLDAGSRWTMCSAAELTAAPPRAGGFTAEDAARARSAKAALAERIYPAPTVESVSPLRSFGRSLRSRVGR